MSVLGLANEFRDALEAGDIERVRACYAPEAEIWHNFDRKTQTVDENLAVLQLMIARSSRLRYDVKRLEEIENGYLQHHVLRIDLKSGEELETDALALVTVANGQISRIDEFIDAAPLAKLFA